MNTHDIETVLRQFLTSDGYIAADDIPAICAAIEAYRKRTTKQLAAYEALVASLEEKCTHMRMMYDELKARTNPDLLASERAANAILTAELEADRKRSGEPVAESIEKLAINRYRPVPEGLLAYKVVAGDGSRSLFSGTKDECKILAAKLTEAFLDGAHVASQSAEPSRDENQEPFGYFRPEPFGWTDCAPTDEGAIALYERPQAQGEPVGESQRVYLHDEGFPEYLDGAQCQYVIERGKPYPHGDPVAFVYEKEDAERIVAALNNEPRRGEPVAYIRIIPYDDDEGNVQRDLIEADKVGDLSSYKNFVTFIPLYTVPQPTEHNNNYKELYEQMCNRCDSLDAKLAEYERRGEPIANLWVNPETLEFEVDSCNHPIDELIPVYEAPQPAEPSDEMEAMEAVMESIDPATWPGLTVAQRCALGRFAKPQPTEPVKVPSREEVVDLWEQAMRETSTGLDAMEYFARALLARYSRTTLPAPKPDPHYEEGVTCVVTHAQRQAYVDGWNDYRKEALKEPGV